MCDPQYTRRPSSPQRNPLCVYMDPLCKVGFPDMGRANDPHDEDAEGAENIWSIGVLGLKDHTIEGLWAISSLRVGVFRRLGFRVQGRV